MTGEQKLRFDALAADRREWVDANRKNKFEGGIKNLLTDLYPDNAHFIYELLQNAEDAGATTVRFTLTDKAVEFEHDGSRLFSEKDVESITSIGTSTKKDDATAIGKFGVGFKAVFAYTQTPEIHSGVFHFKISDLVVPQAISPGGVNGMTTFVFPFDNPKKTPKTAVAEIERGLRELTDNTLLFLSNIRKVEYLLPDGNTLGSLERTDADRQPTLPDIASVSGCQIEIRSFQPGAKQEAISHWLRYTSGAAVTNDDGQSTTCRIAAAFKLEPSEPEETKPAKGKSGKPKAAWRIVPCDPGQVSIFFPCEKETSKLRFHLHAPFASTVARDSVRDCPANSRLRDALASLVAESLPDIRDRDLLTMEFLAVLPIPDDTLSPFYEPIRSAIVTAFKTQNLTPIKSGGHLKADRLYCGSSDISAVIDDDDLAFLTGLPPPLWAANAPQRGQRADKFLGSLEIDEWGWKGVAKVFQSCCTDKGQKSKIETWICKKSDTWLIQFYALLAKHAEQTDPYMMKRAWHELAAVRVVGSASRQRITAKCVDAIPAPDEAQVRHVTPNQAFFPEQNTNKRQPLDTPSDILLVKPEVYENGPLSESTKEPARAFLRSIGVREYDLRVAVEHCLVRYQTEGVPDDNHFEQIRFFVAFWRKYPNDLPNEIKSARYLWAFKDGNPENMCWYSPLEIALDTPYEETGLAEFSSVHGKAILWPGYLEKLGKNTSHQEFVSFLKAMGVMYRLKVVASPTRWWHPNGNKLVSDDFSKYSLGNERSSSKEIDEDWTIDGFDQYLLCAINGKLRASQLIWAAIITTDSKAAKARYAKNGKSHLIEVASLLTQRLNAAAWIPDRDGVVRKPQDMTREMLREDFKFDDRNGLLTAIGFGENAEKQSAEHQARETKAREFGFSAEELDELARAKKEGRLQINPRVPEFPDRTAPDPERRSAKVAAEAAAAPAKTYETRERSVRTSKGGVAATTYLSNQYTGADTQMVCQCCRKEMPFRKRDGKPYFEAVEAFGREDITAEHEAPHLALCPLCAAKYKEFVKRDDAAREALKEDVQTAPNGQREFDLMLDTPARLRFTGTHVCDLRAVLSTSGTKGVY